MLVCCLIRWLLGVCGFVRELLIVVATMVLACWLCCCSDTFLICWLVWCGLFLLFCGFGCLDYFRCCCRGFA